MKNIVRNLSLLLIVFATSISIFAQEAETADSAYLKLKERTIKSIKDNSFSEFQGIGVETRKVGDSAFNVKFALGFSSLPKRIRSFSFTVQPILISGQSISEFGKSSTIRSSQMELDGQTEIVLKPEITDSFPKEANAVKITIAGFEEDMQKVATIIMPVSSETKVSALGKIVTKADSVSVITVK